MPKRPLSWRWTREHGRKICHRWWIGAWWHAFRINYLIRKNFRHAAGKKWKPYVCRWGQWFRDGETAPAHWHIGRPGKHTSN